MISEPSWVIEARKHVGQAEVPGARSNEWIARLWMRAQWLWMQMGADDSRAPWCGAFVAHCLRESGAALPQHWYRARGYLDWGSPTSPVVGAVVVYERGASGHVGFVVGRDARGNYVTLGGNQGNKVSLAPFLPSRVLGFRWPLDALDVPKYPLPLIGSTGAVSSNEG